MNFRFNIDDKPSRGALLLYGLQWLMICIPVVLTSTIVAPPGGEVFFTQKLFAICGLTIIIQVLLGHRMPLVAGPAAVLLVGTKMVLPDPKAPDYVAGLADYATDFADAASTIYPSMIIGGLIVTLLAAVGAIKHIQKIFTPRIVASIVLLIAFTLIQPIVGLIFADKEHIGIAIAASIITLIVMAWANKVFKGVWKSTVVILAMIVGTLLYYSYAGFPEEFKQDSKETSLFIESVKLDVGVILAFVFSYIALIINQVGSVQALGKFVGADNMENRQKRGLLMTGIMNIASGATGVLGPVDYSLSPGVVASTSCASRYAILPAAAAMVVLAFFPDVIAVLLTIPQPVMGIVLLFLMSTQVAAGLELINSTKAVSSFRDGLVLGIPIMLTFVLSFAPQEAKEAIPEIIRPILSNGFVMGIIVIIILEHIVLRERRTENGKRKTEN